MDINGSTKLYALLGHPVEHSFSPEIHNGELKENDINGRYLAFDVPSEKLEAAVKGLFALGAIGANVTVPHKTQVIDYLDGISKEAALIGAVNTLIRTDSGYRGENTDGRGFIRSLEVEKNFNPCGKKVLIFGAGGASRGVAISMALAGALEVNIVNRSIGKAKEISDIINRETGAKSEAILLKKDSRGESAIDGSSCEHLDPYIESADLIVNTTSIGMYPDVDQKLEINYDKIHESHLVADLIYNPEKTDFLKAAETRGAKIINGSGMLYYQAELAFELWTGKSFKKKRKDG